MERATSPLDTIAIATPCSADWSAMSGDDRARFCGSCQLNVYDLSAMTRREAEELIAAREGRVCVRLHRRADGTVLTRDCPVGVRAVRDSRMRRVRSMIAAATALVAGAFGVEASSSSLDPIMGKMAPVTEETSDTTQGDREPPPDEDDNGYSVIMGGLMPAPEMGEVAAQDAVSDSTDVVEAPGDDAPVVDAPAIDWTDGDGRDLR